MKKLVGIAVLLLIFVYCLVFVLPLAGSSSILPQQDGFVALLNLWHIESFEGGAYSRSRWLVQQASAYERMNNGIYVHVNTLTYEQALSKLNNGETFDLISLPSGYGYPFLTHLEAYSGKDFTREDLSSSARVKGVQYALPYLLGGYLLAARTSQLTAHFSSPKEALTTTNSPNFPSSFWGKNKQNSLPFPPLMVGCESFLFNATACLNHNRLTYAPWAFRPVQTQYEAYTAFINGETPLLLGTQRDFYRLNNRVKAGNLEQLSYTFLGNYSDLVQYIAIGKNAAEKYAYCQAFAEYLTTDAQGKITALEMFSVNGVSLYTGGEISLFEQALATPLIVPNLFENRD